MGETTGIAWTDHTFNPWWGCTKVSAGCDHCYAETFDKRVGGSHWGSGAPRRTFGDKHWNEPLKWNRAAEQAGKRARVFCASMADVFDDEAPDGARDRLWALIRATPRLDWQLLTKRPHNIRKNLPADWGDGYANVWLGTTCEDQKAADLRVPVLLQVPARVRFLSVEPQIGPVDLRLPSKFFTYSNGDLGCAHCCHGDRCDDPTHFRRERCPFCRGTGRGRVVDWVIVGGESGHHARPFDLAWAESLRAQCEASGVAFFFKQTGSVITGKASDHGARPEQWPESLRVQRFPGAGDAPKEARRG